MGLGVGLSAGPSAAALVDFSPKSRAGAAGPTATVAQSLGMSAALLMSGVLIEYCPWPTRLNFIVLGLLLAMLLLALRGLPRPHGKIDWASWRPSTPRVSTSERRPFLMATASLTTAYTHGALLLALGGQLMHDLIGSPNVLVNAALLAFFPIAQGIAGVLTRRVEPQTLMTWGSASSVAGMALFVTAIALRSVPLTFVAASFSGAGYSFQVSGGLGILAASSAPGHRASLLSAALLVAYLSMGSAALLLGLAAKHWGLGVAADIGAASIAALSGIAWTIASGGQPSRSRPGSQAKRSSAST
jgi:MFS family permease